jgi:hypothetical protein
MWYTWHTSYLVHRSEFEMKQTTNKEGRPTTLEYVGLKVPNSPKWFWGPVRAGTYRDEVIDRIRNGFYVIARININTLTMDEMHIVFSCGYPYEVAKELNRLKLQNTSAVAA